jgi:transcriptional regulator with XRE-family HTH domain
MPNERLRDALLRNGFTLDQVSRAIGVDPKTVERWIGNGRTPYPKHRHAIAAMLRERETYLWPDAVTPQRSTELAGSEVVKIYPRRHAVPAEIWTRLMDEALDQIDVLVYAGLFLVDDPRLIKTLRAKAGKGTRIRLLTGDPASQAVAKRSLEENIGKGVIPNKVRNLLAFLRPLAEVEGIQIRCHGTPLYNSIYRFDDDMLINTHLYGFMAAHAPVLHLRRLSTGELFESYSESFENVWNAAKLPKW